MTLITKALYDYCSAHSSAEPEVLQSLRTAIEIKSPQPHKMIDPMSGRFLSFLVALHQPQRILEIGTFGGYSTLWLAYSFQGEKLVTIDRSDALIPMAQQFWQRSPNGKVIEFLHGEADHVLDGLLESNQLFDFFFIDANKVNYPAYFEKCLRLRRSKTAVIVVDNVLGFRSCHLPECDHRLAKALDQFNKFCLQQENLTVQILPLGDGIMLCTEKNQSANNGFF